MRGLVVGLLAVAVLFTCVASLCSGDNLDDEVGVSMLAKTEKGDPITGTGSPIKIVPMGEVRGENAVPVKLIPAGKAPPTGGTEIKTVFVPWGKENLPPENVPPKEPPEQPPENVPPEVPPEKPPEKPPEAPPIHIELIPNPIRVRLARAGPENVPGVKLMPEGELPDNMLRVMPAPELPDNMARVRLMPDSDVPLPENTVRIKTTEN